MTLCRYIVFLARSLAFSSIQNYLNIVRILHLEAGFINPLSAYTVKMLLKGVNRLIGKPPKPKLPITPDILLKMHGQLDMSIPFNKTFWAAALVAFFTFLRKSSLLPKSGTCFDPALHLSGSSLQFVNDGAIIFVRHTKTIQYHERILSIPIPRVKESPLCPIQALYDLLKMNGVYDLKSPLFCYRVTGSLTTLTHSTFVSALKKTLGVCGYDSAQYSGHSFRRGGRFTCFHL